MRPYLLFTINLGLVWTYIYLLSRTDSGLDLTFLSVAAPLSAIIVFAQTPILMRLRSVIGRLATLYGSMVLFLFFTGVFLSWNSPVGSEPAGSWLGRFDAGLRIAVFGHVLGLPGFFLIAGFNFVLFRISSWNSKGAT